MIKCFFPKYRFTPHKVKAAKVETKHLKIEVSEIFISFSWGTKDESWKMLHYLNIQSNMHVFVEFYIASIKIYVTRLRYCIMEFERNCADAVYA